MVAKWSIGHVGQWLAWPIDLRHLHLKVTEAIKFPLDLADDVLKLKFHRVRYVVEKHHNVLGVPDFQDYLKSLEQVGQCREYLKVCIVQRQNLPNYH